jgi:hypothetical protein
MWRVGGTSFWYHRGRRKDKHDDSGKNRLPDSCLTALTMVSERRRDARRPLGVLPQDVSKHLFCVLHPIWETSRGHGQVKRSDALAAESLNKYTN